MTLQITARSTGLQGTRIVISAYTGYGRVGVVKVWNGLEFPTSKVGIARHTLASMLASGADREQQMIMGDYIHSATSGHRKVSTRTTGLINYEVKQ